MAGAFGILEGMIEPGHIVTVIGAVLLLVGTWITARATSRSKATEIQHERERTLAEERAAEAEQRRLERQEFVQQLREERDAANERTDKLNVALDRMWTDKSVSRDYVAALRAQIWAGGTPPPVTAPEGYIE